MELQVISIADEEDGGATLTLDMDRETLLAFAKVGIVKVLTDEANRVIEEHGNEYSEDSGSNAAAD